MNKTNYFQKPNYRLAIIVNTKYYIKNGIY